MFWKLTDLSSSSPVEAILDKEDFTLEELLDEEEIIHECKSLNNRLIHFLRDRDQVEQLIRFIVEEPLEDAEKKRTLKFPFIACEIFTCEIDVILKTLVEEEELMNLLFSFLEPNRGHSVSLAGYFSKVVICLMVRKTEKLINYVQVHQNVFRQLVDLIGITSIMEVLVRLVGSDENMYSNYIDVMQWLADSNLLEMIVDKLSPLNPPEVVHGNAAETLCAITRNTSSALANKISSPSFVARILFHALEDSDSKSALFYSLSVCISLLDLKSSTTSSFFHSFHGQHMFETPIPVNPETINAMLPKLGDMFVLLNVTSDEKVLPSTYGELRPPLGKHRLKVVEFIAVLLKVGNEIAEKELVSTGIIRRIVDLFFEYSFNNALHHHAQNIILLCLESKSDAVVDHLLCECDLVGKIVQTDKNPILSGDSGKPTLPSVGKVAPRSGNIGHITRIANKLFQISIANRHIQAYLQGNVEWNEWEDTVLQERNAVENVFRWACGRPSTTAMEDITRVSIEDELPDIDYDVAALANNLSQAFRYKIYGNEDGEEDNGAHERDDDDVYFDDESAEVVISSIRLGDDDQGSLFTNSNWFSFDNGISNGHITALTSGMDEINLNGNSKGGNSSSDDEVVVGEDEELLEATGSGTGTSFSGTTFLTDKPNTSSDLDLFRFDSPDNDADDLFDEKSIPDWVRWEDSPNLQTSGFSFNPFVDQDDDSVGDITPASISPELSPDIGKVHSLFEEDVEFVGVEIEGTKKAMEQALKEGIVGEAGPLKKNLLLKLPENGNSDEGHSVMKEFNDANYWRVDQEVSIIE